jgi:serine/threonine-protein kinase HipA
MAKQGVSKGSVTALDRLAYMGKRGMGALEFRPAKGSQKESAEPIAMQRLVEAARNVVHGRIADDEHAQAALANIIRVGTSAGGARAKAVVAWNEATGELRSGQFDTAPGFSHWLLKFDGMGKDFELGLSGGYGRIEYAYYLMATAAGVAMSRCHLLEENGRAHFMTQRFDRDGNVKHHVQSLCAMQHLDYMLRHVHAYEQLFLTLRDLGLGPEAAEQVFRRMAFNVMARNCDDHTKNHALLLREGGAWSLAPAYDVTHAHNPKGEWTAEHLMSVNGKFDGITRGDLIEVGDRFGVPSFSKAIDEVAAALGRWREFAGKAGLPPSRIEEIEKEFVLLKSPSGFGRKRSAKLMQNGR